MRLSTLLAATVAVGLAAAGAAPTVSAALNAVPAASAITLSTSLTPGKDARVVTATVNPPASWEPPLSWEFKLGADAQDVLVSPGYIVAVSVIDEAAPTCKTLRATVWPSAPKDSLTRTLKFCRPYTASEVAFRDSFPAVRIVQCTPTGYVHKDSIAEIGKDSTIQLGLMAHNRYTGEVINTSGDSLCEPARRQLQSEKPG